MLTLHSDTTRIAVSVESAKGNLAAVVALEATKSRLLGQILLYPATDVNFETSFYEQFAKEYFLTAEKTQWSLDVLPISNHDNE